MFRVLLNTEDLILDYVSVKIRHRFLMRLPGNIVKIETSCYDSTRRRTIYSLRNKNSKD